MAPLVYASSIAAYGPAGTLGGDDQPSTLYGVHKRANESTALRYAEDYGVPSIGLRPHTVFGPARDQGLTSAPTVAMLAAAARVPNHIPFGGRRSSSTRPTWARRSCAHRSSMCPGVGAQPRRHRDRDERPRRRDRGGRAGGTRPGHGGHDRAALPGRSRREELRGADGRAGDAAARRGGRGSDLVVLPASVSGARRNRRSLRTSQRATCASPCRISAAGSAASRTPKWSRSRLRSPARRAVRSGSPTASTNRWSPPAATA